MRHQMMVSVAATIWAIVPQIKIPQCGGLPASSRVMMRIAMIGKKETQSIEVLPPATMMLRSPFCMLKNLSAEGC